MNLQEAIDAFDAQLRADGRSAHTVDQYARHLAAFARTTDAVLEAITPATIATFFNSEGARTRPDGTPKRATSVNAMRSSLRSFFGYTHAAGITPTNPARLLRRARTGTAPPKALSDDDREKLLTTLAAAEGAEARRDELLIRLLLGAGLRIGSAVGLDVNDVDLERGELALRKTKGDRPETVFLSADLVLRLRRFLEGREGAVFVGRSGERLTTRQAGRRFAELVKTAVLSRSASPHTCRHDFATRLLARTHDVALVQSALRHRSIASTMNYARVAPESVRRAIEG